ncbi:DsrE family protein [Halobaculum sp. MBLA0147]|uniref:DsrE family protein n=1 Tax=Halobaculum sp. MBLA0147 TaxID=3079934 RepID=UPI0035238EF0
MGKFAVVLTAGPDDAGSAVNGFEYALSLADADNEVAVFLDGAATKWPGEVQRRADHPVSESLDRLEEHGALAGACAYCADVFGATEGCEDADVALHGTAGEEHAPDVGELVADGYDLLPVS